MTGVFETFIEHRMGVLGDLPLEGFETEAKI
jgi:hypothetical protein